MICTKHKASVFSAGIEIDDGMSCHVCLKEKDSKLEEKFSFF